MVRAATLDDIPRIAEIHICGWRFAYKGIISDIELFKKRLVSKSIQNLERQIKEGLNILVYEDDFDGIIKGFVFHGKCRDEDKENSYEAYALYIQPEFTNIGIGSALLKEVEKKAEEIGINEIVVWVLEKNGIGMKFYKKYGFVDDGIKKKIEEWNELEIRMALTTASTCQSGLS